MSFVLFAGSMTRFFVGDWEPEPVPASAPDDGADEDDDTSEPGARIGGASSGDGGDEDFAEDDEGEDEDDDGADAGDDDDFDPDDVQAFFEDFQRQLGDALRKHLSGPLRWTETIEAPYLARTLSPRDYGALLVLAARVHAKGRRLPPVDPTGAWLDDPAVQAIQGADKDLEPVHHLVNADSWLPGDFTPIAQTEVPDRDLTIGSLAKLQAILAALEPHVARPAAELGLPPRVAADARRAYGAFKAVSDFAAKNRLPVVIES